VDLGDVEGDVGLSVALDDHELWEPAEADAVVVVAEAEGPVVRVEDHGAELKACEAVAVAVDPEGEVLVAEGPDVAVVDAVEGEELGGEVSLEGAGGAVEAAEGEGEGEEAELGGGVVAGDGLGGEGVVAEAELLVEADGEGDGLEGRVALAQRRSGGPGGGVDQREAALEGALGAEEGREGGVRAALDEDAGLDVAEGGDEGAALAQEARGRGGGQRGEVWRQRAGEEADGEEGASRARGP
jgi:hypothetical protein